jgi:hypothetical protein
MSTNGESSRRHEQDDVSRISVAYLILGYENNRNAVIGFFRNAKSSANWVTDAILPTVGSNIDWLWKEISDARRRGVKCRELTDITKDNLSHCKKNMARLDEFRHLGGMAVNFGVSDNEALVIVPSLAPREERSIQFIYSDSESVVEYKRQCFDLLWDRSIPGQTRINELEGGGGVSEGGGAGESLAAPPSTQTQIVIDRIHSCMECKQTFVYQHEVEEHRRAIGHNNFRAFPVV